MSSVGFGPEYKKKILCSLEFELLGCCKRILQLLRKDKRAFIEAIAASSKVIAPLLIHDKEEEALCEASVGIPDHCSISF